MMSTKYIFLDIDGTLIGFGKPVSDSTKKAIELARANGHKVFICTGRARCEIFDDVLCVPLDGIVGSAGAYVEIDGKMTHHHPMTEEMNRRLFDYFEEKQLSILVETNEDLLGNESALECMRIQADYYAAHGIAYDTTLFAIARPLEDIDNPTKLAINKILYVNSPYEDEMIRADLGSEFTVVDSAIQLDGRSGEISELGMNKGYGMEYVVKHFGGTMKDTIAIGDGENDIAMLKAADVGIAMGNANPLLKEIADYVTTHVDEDGIWNAFKHYGLI